MTDQELTDLVASLAVVNKENAAQQKLTDIAIKENAEQQKLTDIAIKENAEQQKLTDIAIKETAAQQKLTDIAIKETAAQQKLTEIQLAKTDAQLAKTDAQLAKTDAQLAKTDAQLAKTDAQLAKTDKKLNGVATMLGGIGNNQGDVAEEFYFNSLKAKPFLNGINFDLVDKNITRSKGKIEDEYDIVLINGKDIFVIEVKYKAHQKDLDRLLNKKYPNFKKLYPEYQDYQHHLGLASFYINDDLKANALENGVSVLQRKGDIIETTAA